MSFIAFIEEKIFHILFQIFFLAFVLFLLAFSRVQGFYIFLITLIFIVCQAVFLLLSFWRERRETSRIIEMADNFKEAYYIADVLPKPRGLENQAYYYALKRACKAMNDRISELEGEQLEYQEYVESFAHEIKIPIGALSLTFDNAKDYVLKKETDKIFLLVEQMLYYARSENTEKDYFVKKLNLEEAVHNVILKFRHSLLEAKVHMDIHDLDCVVNTDEKWITFVLSQIFQNSLKYFNKEENHLTIFSVSQEGNVRLVIEDNGCGITNYDLPRVFEKGFTGANRKRANATGMGLYLSKKLCDWLGLHIEISSRENEYTRVCVIFPKGTVHLLSDNE